MEIISFEYFINKIFCGSEFLVPSFKKKIKDFEIFRFQIFPQLYHLIKIPLCLSLFKTYGSENFDSQFR
jgi:hypothetical protein